MSPPGVYCSLGSGEMAITALKYQLVSQRQPDMLHKPLPTYIHVIPQLHGSIQSSGYRV